MDITLKHLMDYGTLILQSFNEVVEFLNLSWSGIEAMFADNKVVLFLIKLVNFVNPMYYLGADYTLLDFMIGSGVVFFLIYQFVIWLLNLIT